MSKGEEIRFVKGKYAGLSGWIDRSKKKKKNSCFRSVIVGLDNEDDDFEEEKATRVKISSFRKQVSGDPRTFEEAAVMQHKDIEKAMIDLATMFAQCAVQDTNEVLRLFNTELALALEFQKKLGSKARYRGVAFSR
jgi:hypothetical protein